MADILSNKISPEVGFVARFGGEEFILVLYNYDFEQTNSFISDIQNTLENKHIEHKGNEAANWLTLSFGFVSLNLNNTYPSNAYEQLTNRADASLYKSKQQGRNRIVGTNFN